ncbi:MAG: hypothetical protein EBZ48_14110 [Proteobacteria bacterium]|nr:hypothetical protein [Pseudomonadota bacterium]
MRNATISQKIFSLCAMVGVLGTLSGCGVGGSVLNPFYEEPSPVAYLGAPNDHALNESASRAGSAREALEQMGSYQRAHLPQPVNPVVNPAVVRLMWVPDHLNKTGDLVPAHYYYLRVKRDDWAVSDAFELEGQLNASTGGQGSAVPYQYENERND